VIANLTLDGLERLLRAHYPPNTKRAQRAKVNLVRYGDDFIITGSSQAVLEQDVKPLVEPFSANVVWSFPRRKPIARLSRTGSISGTTCPEVRGETPHETRPKHVHTCLRTLRIS